MDEQAAEKQAYKACCKIAWPMPARGEQQNGEQNAVGKPDEVETSLVEIEVVGAQDGD